MLIGLIRPVETRALSVEGESLEALRSAVEAQLPEGWEITSIPAVKNGAWLTSTATIARRDSVTEIQGEDITALAAKVPEGYTLLSVRSRA